MNPSAWRWEHQVALLPGTVLGIVAGLLVGFFHHDIHLANIAVVDFGLEQHSSTIACPIALPIRSWPKRERWTPSFSKTFDLGVLERRLMQSTSIMRFTSNLGPATHSYGRQRL